MFCCQLNIQETSRCKEVTLWFVFSAQNAASIYHNSINFQIRIFKCASEMVDREPLYLTPLRHHFSAPAVKLELFPINYSRSSVWVRMTGSYNTLANIHTSTSPRLSACHTDCHWHKWFNIKHSEVKGKCLSVARIFSSASLSGIMWIVE